MKSLRIMSFDLDSFVLVKGVEEKSKRVIDYIRNLDIDLALLQGDNNLIYNTVVEDNVYAKIYNYLNYLFLMKPDLAFVDDYLQYDCGGYITRFVNGEDVAFYNVKKYNKESLSGFKRVFKEYKNIDHKVLVGTLQNVNIDDFCKKYDLDNICSGPRSNHILVSKGIDAKVVESPVMKSVEVQPMVVDVTYKKVRSDYEKFKNT